MLKKQALLIAISYTLALVVVSLVKLDLSSVKDVVPSFSDKIFHFLAYALFTWLWFNTFYFKFNFGKIKGIFTTIVISITFGIIIEVMQWLVTSSRSFDLLDILANTLGVLLAAILINSKIKLRR
ncbi:MAG TPA: VanZ family protein [Xanthomarina sp.]|nr:VanZ family protein [Xanthomarina sp.]